MTCKDLVRRWQAAREKLLTALRNHEAWLRDAKRGGREVDNTTLEPLWRELAAAEAALKDWKDDIHG